MTVRRLPGDLPAAHESTGPLELLRERGVTLTEEACDRLQSKVRTDVIPAILVGRDITVHTLSLMVPALNYTLGLARVDLGPSIYPLKFWTLVGRAPDKPHVCHSREELEEALDSVLQGPDVRRATEILLAKIEE